MATKTDMVNLALLKLGGATSIGTMLVDTIADSIFADPSTATDDTTKHACLRYSFSLKHALRDIKPKFARRYADCGAEILITQDGANGTPFEKADYECIYELPSDYLVLIAQIDESNKDQRYDAKEIMVHGYAHIVKGSDDQSYYCTADVTGAAANTPITGASYASYWSLFDDDDDYGADFETGHPYKYNATGKLLLANDYSNNDGDSAYVEYMAYSVTGVGDDPDYYDEPFIEAFTTLLASEMASFTKNADARAALRIEYERLAKQMAEGLQSEPDYEEVPETWLEARTS